jgi:F-type H+-transporting ATPase subunit alpha
LDLAQYRALEAFAKFGSDLDKATQQQLRRGARLVEILKQKQFKPMAVEKQIALIWVATNGYLDDLPLDVLAKFEKEFMEMLDLQHTDILAEIIFKKEMSEELTGKLKKAVEPFVDNFKKTLK